MRYQKSAPDYEASGPKVQLRLKMLFLESTDEILSIEECYKRNLLLTDSNAHVDKFDDSTRFLCATHTVYQSGG